MRAPGVVSLPALAALVALSWLAPAAARAESWGSTAGALLETARSVEIVDVTAVSGAHVDGKLAVAVRTARKVGDPVRVAVGGLGLAVGKGDRLLVVCDAAMCPRAAGVERDGAFTLEAQQPGDGAAVFPALVERGSVALLAAGSPAPALCLRGTFALIDDRSRALFEVSVSAADGGGRGTLEGVPVAASRMSLEDLGLRPPAGGGAVALHRDGAFARRKDGCYGASYTLAGALPRTRAGLGRALAGTLAPSPVARGTLATPAGARRFELLLTPDGQLTVAGDLAEGTPIGAQSFAARQLSFYRLKPGASRTDDILLVDLGATGSTPTIVEHLRAARAPTARLATRRDTATDPAKDALLGTVALTYLPER